MMGEITQQLTRVRRRSRRLLVLRRASQVIVGTLVTALVLGWLDFGLRLPGLMRLVIGLVGLALLVVWAGTRLPRAWRFKPSLEYLALRAEAMYPQLAGSLATAVAFSVEPERFDQPSRTAELAEACIEQAQDKASQADLTRLVDPSSARRTVIAAVLAVTAVVGHGVVFPTQTATAAQRWLMPLGVAAWPKRVQLVHETSAAAWPADTPVPLHVEVTRGDREGLRVELRYRVAEPGRPAGAWRSVLLEPGAATEDGRDYGFLLSLPEAAPASLIDPDPDEYAYELQYRFLAGDAETQTTALTIVQPPSLSAVEATVDPPAYAVDLVPNRRLVWDLQGAQSLSALAGSDIDLRLRFDKPVLVDDATPVAVGTSGLDTVRVEPADAKAGDDGRSYATTFNAQLRLGESGRVVVAARDAFGLETRREVELELIAEPDSPPAAFIEPLEHSVWLPRARFDVEAGARDEVGLASLRLETYRLAPSDDADLIPAAEDERLLAAPVLRRARTLNLSAALDLDTIRQAQGLEPGDRVLIVARAQDVFDQDGQTHEPAVATRVIRVVDEAALLDDFQRELADLRARLEPIDRAQAEASQAEPVDARPTQESVSISLDARQAQLRQLMSRAEANRLENEDLELQLAAADELFDGARAASAAAEQALDQAVQTPEEQAALDEASAEQARVDEQIDQLLELLDAGRGVMALNAQLRQVRALQEALLNETAALQQEHAGLTLDELPEEGRQALSQIAQRQDELREQVDELTDRMRATAEALRLQSDAVRDEAAAEALEAAAELAREQALGPTMTQSSEQLQQNRLSPARQGQTQALSTLDQMARQLGNQQQRRQEVLERRLRSLRDKLVRLIERQGGLLESLRNTPAEAEVSPLAEGQVQLRQVTMSTRRDAETQQETQPIAGLIGAAVDAQADAVRALRNADRVMANEAETSALTRLEESLARLDEVLAEVQNEQAQEQRQQLAQAYLQLADEQVALRERLREISPDGQVTRRERPRLRELGDKEDALREAAAELGQQVQDTLVFRSLHGRIDADALAATGNLRLGSAVAAVELDMTRVESALRQAAEALQDPPDDSPFNEANGGGGGGGGGAGGPPPLVPPLAELRLLRALQSDLLDRTRFLDETVALPLGEGDSARVTRLADEQEELSELGEALIEQLREQVTPPAEIDVIESP